MTPHPPDPGFFLGYSKKIPPAFLRLSLVFAACFLLGLATAALALSLGGSNPGSGGYVDELKGGRVSGVLEDRPYPILRVPARDGRASRAIMLAGQGKTGVAAQAGPLEGRWTEVGGIFVKRGDLDMLLVAGDGIKPATTPVNAAEPEAPVPLGRWRLTGEICDGKCYAGAMRPGSGLAHKACANLCIIGGVPPVFVTTAPVEGRNFLLMAGPDGGPLPRALLDKTAVLMELEGEVERRDDLLIFRVDMPGKAGTGS
ncbi:hypothetical protein ACLE20_02580 [Rhizobium sp. YIM 134829]|uniref:hypothetical protein n=1 Tax=Rhizobium sp. YIM 134829 TaxID=3390453 RepID=UPI0039787847